MINQSWDANGNSFNLVDSIGLMVYSGATSLDWTKSYTNGPNQGAGNSVVIDVQSFSIYFEGELEVPLLSPRPLGCIYGTGMLNS